MRLVWFSQEVGPGRGLEDLFGALPRVRGEWRLEIRGRASAEAMAWFRHGLGAGLADRVHFEPALAPESLPAAVARNDVGLALETPDCRNKDLTASNKMFEYLQAGLTVVASQTAGQAEVLARLPGAGRLYRSRDIDALAAHLNDCVSRIAALREARERIHREANAAFSAERLAPVLLESVDRALRRAPGPLAPGLVR